MINLNDFLIWQQECEGRTVTITLGTYMNPLLMKIWCYDYNLEVGQHVSSVDEINLEAEKEKQDRERYEKLKEKFGKD